MTRATPRLYYVKATQFDTENADAFVWAASPSQAAKLCQSYWAGLAGGRLSEIKVEWVDEVPQIAPRKGQVVHWENIVRHEQW